MRTRLPYPPPLKGKHVERVGGGTGGLGDVFVDGGSFCLLRLGNYRRERLLAVCTVLVGGTMGT